MSAPADGLARGVRLLVSGRVQGVGFRWFVRHVARELAIVGRARNLADGRVEVEAAGDPEALAALKARLEEGPPGARVDEVREEELSAVPPWDRFEIDR